MKERKNKTHTHTQTNLWKGIIITNLTFKEIYINKMRRKQQQQILGTQKKTHLMNLKKK